MGAEVCAVCEKPLDGQGKCDCPRCPECHRLKAECLTDVDERFPAEAKAAFDAAGYTQAFTCEAGQAKDAKRTGGWCYDRARFDKRWTGTPLTPAERAGRGVTWEQEGLARTALP